MPQRDSLQTQKHLLVPESQCVGLHHWKGLQILHFLPTFVKAVKQLALKALWVFNFICLYTKAQITFCFYWHRLGLSEQFQFTPVVLTEASLLLNQTQMKPCICDVLRESGVLEPAFQRLHLAESSQLG